MEKHKAISVDQRVTGNKAMSAKYRIVEFNTFNTGAQVPLKYQPQASKPASCSESSSAPSGQALAGTGALVWEGELLERAY